jgi:hypothetical protein
MLAQNSLATRFPAISAAIAAWEAHNQQSNEPNSVQHNERLEDISGGGPMASSQHADIDDIQHLDSNRAEADVIYMPEEDVLSLDDPHMLPGFQNLNYEEEVEALEDESDEESVEVDWDQAEAFGEENQVNKEESSLIEANNARNVEVAALEASSMCRLPLRLTSDRLK